MNQANQVRIVDNLVLSLNETSGKAEDDIIMCVWQELPGYDPEYTETDRKDIQNLAKEIETSYARYGKYFISKLI